MSKFETADGGTVLLVDPVALDEKIELIKKDGPGSLQIITDFDMTMTRFMVDGERGESSHGATERCTALGEEFRAANRKLFNKYYPKEIDTTMDREEKFQLMTEWWTQAHELLVKHKMNRKYLKQMVDIPNMRFRDGVTGMLQTAQKNDVLVHIFSAGLYDIIHAFLENQGVDGYGAHVVGNMMDFDDTTGDLKGFKGEIIHSLSKNSEALKSSERWNDVTKRRNVLLLGDSPGDTAMTKGLDVAKERILSIGFLNIKVDERLEKYKGMYDVIIFGDPSFSFINKTLANLLDLKEDTIP